MSGTSACALHRATSPNCCGHSSPHPASSSIGVLGRSLAFRVVPAAGQVLHLWDLPLDQPGRSKAPVRSWITSKLRMHLIVQPARLRNRFQPGLARMSKRDSSRMAAPLGPQCLCLRWPSSEALAQTLALTLTFAHDLERRRTVSLLMLLLQPSICWLLRYYDAFGFACQCSVTKSEK